MARKDPETRRPVPPDTRTMPLQDTISRQARTLWEKYGRPEGRDVPIWLEAERQVLGVDAKANQQPGGAVPAAPLSDVLYPPVQPAPRGHGEQAPDGKLPGPGADTGLPK